MSEQEERHEVYSQEAESLEAELQKKQLAWAIQHHDAYFVYDEDGIITQAIYLSPMGKAKNG